MGLIQFDKPRARPTPNDVGASKAWIGRGLVALFDARYGIERISGDRASVNTATRAVSEGGVAADFSGTANQRYAHRPAYAQSGPFSLLILCDIDALTGYGALISKQQSSTTHCPYELRIGSGATDSKFEVVRCSATNFGTAQASATSILSAPAKLVRLVLSVTNSDKAALGTLWVNGVGYSLNGIVSGEDATGTGTPDVWIGRRQDGATQLDGRIYHIGLVNRAVTAGEAYDFTRNPWSVFEPKRIWVPVSAGGGGTYNVTLAESTAAADALGAVGSVVAFVAEAAAASELASTVGTVAAAVSESAAAAETLAAVEAVAAALTEPATVADLVAATMVAQAAVAEALAAADVVSAGPQVSGAMAEAATAADALTVTASLVAQVAEAASAADAAATAQQLLALITEASTVADQVSGAAPAAYSVTLAEVAAALDVITAALTGTTVWPLLAARGVSAHGHGSARPEQLSTATRSNTQ